MKNKIFFKKCLAALGIGLKKKGVVICPSRMTKPDPKITKFCYKSSKEGDVGDLESQW